ncbi:DUF7674 family protein [Winslowiella iniecta]|uniref:DUF7674 domain-containing protein n=1 Tax=Winslowiella iniecta TaxID=1560201 RepID=A0A0L7SX37_9GAMM|nr:hypothetical protein [Winslowiella iniecta]KOC87678.1 hypothetical protein NG42_19350 [Winslowiella iniecta]KOC89850.1 hypothetical protein NG43_17925 [Winslowiella iniecta]
MIIDTAVHKLKECFPVFDGTYDGEDDVYLAYGSFGSFILDLINIYMSDVKASQNYFYYNLKKMYKNSDSVESEIYKIFSFIDEIFLGGDKSMRDVLNTCIFEALMGNDYSYNLSRKYFSKETYNHYLEITKRVI